MLRTRPASRERGKELRRLETKEGATLRVMRYRLPANLYEPTDCGPKPMADVDSEYLVTLLFSCALDNGSFRDVLNHIDPRLGSLIAIEHQAGGHWQGFAGARLKSLVYHLDAEGVLQFLLFAAKIRNSVDAGKFVRAWDGSQQRLKRFSRYVSLYRPPADERAFAKLLRSWGMDLGLSVPESAPTSLKELDVMLYRLSGYLSKVDVGGRRIKDRGREFEHKHAEGGCGGCS